MKLYHGSNIEVRNPKIIVSARMLDFGAGFYATSGFEQAKHWANLQTKRRRTGKPIVSVYELDIELLQKQLKVMRFESANKEWLHFLAENRKGVYTGEKYDIVIGAVANDNTMTVISDYMTGTIDEETALLLLLSQKLKDQYAFLTWKGLSALKFIEVKDYD
ncbi:hypothetical protein FACS1894190_13750 [Spirochaetia bacterium]|nr:hypothetical protein FACS1894190_13750 [Spirochaetia bacterium]